jgi:hypothetical protein
MKDHQSQVHLALDLPTTMALFATTGNPARTTSVELKVDIATTHKVLYHGYTTINKKGGCLLVLHHRFSHYLPSDGPSCKTWHNQLYTLAGDIQVQVQVQGTQAPQTVEWGQDQMQIYTNTMKVFKLTEQRTLLVGVIDAPTLEAAVADSFV